MYALVTGNNTATNVLTWTEGVDGTSAIALGASSTITEVITKQVITATMVRLDTGVSQTLTGPLIVPYSGTASTAATSWGSSPVKIDDQLLASTASSITFVNPLPTGFRHLSIEWYARGDAAVTSTGIAMLINNDTGANYDFQRLRGTAAVASALEGLGGNQLAIGNIPAASATANYFGTGEARVNYYAGATGNKNVTARSNLWTGNGSGAGFTEIYHGKWRTTGAAVTRIDLLPSSGNFVAGSLFTLYGIP